MKFCGVTEEECAHPERLACAYSKEKARELRQPKQCSVYVQGYRIRKLRRAVGNVLGPLGCAYYIKQIL